MIEKELWILKCLQEKKAWSTEDYVKKVGC